MQWTAVFECPHTGPCVVRFCGHPDVEEAVGQAWDEACTGALKFQGQFQLTGLKLVVMVKGRQEAWATEWL